jgi:hypothetical protein
MANLIEVGSQKVLELTGIQISPPNLIAGAPQNFAKANRAQIKTSTAAMIVRSHRQ